MRERDNTELFVAVKMLKYDMKSSPKQSYFCGKILLLSQNFPVAYLTLAHSLNLINQLQPRRFQSLSKIFPTLCILLSYFCILSSANFISYHTLHRKIKRFLDTPPIQWLTYIYAQLIQHHQIGSTLFSSTEINQLFHSSGYSRKLHYGHFKKITKAKRIIMIELFLHPSY